METFGERKGTEMSYRCPYKLDQQLTKMPETWRVKGASMIGLQTIATRQSLMIGHLAQCLEKNKRDRNRLIMLIRGCGLSLVILVGGISSPSSASEMSIRESYLVSSPTLQSRPESSPFLLAQTQPVLTAGSTGKAVAELQATLKKLNYYAGTVDGIYGESTTQAVANFQKATGLQVDGIVGPATWNSLYLSVRNVPTAASADPLIRRPILQLGSEGKEVTELQAALQLLGYYAGTVDGRYGETTATAVAKFQQQSGLQVDGVAGPATWNRLFPPTPSQNSPQASDGGNTANPQPDCNCDKGDTNTGNADAANSSSSSTNVQLPILRLGMRGPAIINLQERLKALGFLKGAVDGIFGPTTEDAVKAAQRRSQLNPDGIVGPATWRILLR